MTASHGEAVAKAAFFLAYSAAKVVGMGVFQARDSVTEDEVWGQVRAKNPDVKAAYGDYVFGRMMKLSLRWDDDGRVTTNTTLPPSADYQSWCTEYPTFESLIEAAEGRVGKSE